MDGSDCSHASAREFSPDGGASGFTQRQEIRDVYPLGSSLTSSEIHLLIILCIRKCQMRKKFKPFGRY